MLKDQPVISTFEGSLMPQVSQLMGRQGSQLEHQIQEKLWLLRAMKKSERILHHLEWKNHFNTVSWRLTCCWFARWAHNLLTVLETSWTDAPPCLPEIWPSASNTILVKWPVFCTDITWLHFTYKFYYSFIIKR